MKLLIYKQLTLTKRKRKDTNLPITSGNHQENIQEIKENDTQTIL